MAPHVKVLKAKRRARILPILVNLLTAGVATATEIGSNAVDIRGIEAEGLVKRTSQRMTGKKGRPAIEYRLTDSGRKRAKRGLAVA